MSRRARGLVAIGCVAVASTALVSGCGRDSGVVDATPTSSVAASSAVDLAQTSPSSPTVQTSTSPWGTPSSADDAAGSPTGGPSTDGVAPPSPVPAAGVVDVPIPRFDCPPSTVRVGSADELTDALSKARPGQSIHLEPGSYLGTFVTTASGTTTEPIYLCGDRDAVLDGESVTGGYGLHLDGVEHWRVDGFTVRNAQKGVMVDRGSDIALQDLLVEQIGDEAVHLRAFSTSNVVRGLTIRETGKRREKFGEGVYVGTAESNWPTISGGRPDASNGNYVLENVISQTTAEAVDIKEGTLGGVVAGNRFDGSALEGADSWVDVKGNGWLITGNVGAVTPKDGFQTHVIVEGWGDKNVFTDNVADLAGGEGVGFYLHHLEDNRVSCNNRVTGGELSNEPCRS